MDGLRHGLDGSGELRLLGWLWQTPLAPSLDLGGGVTQGKLQRHKAVMGNETFAPGRYAVPSALPVVREDAEHHTGSGPGCSLA